jgi:hypothetical protein
MELITGQKHTNLTGEQCQKLRVALMSAFPNSKDLEMMLWEKLEVKLNSISSEEEYPHTVFEVIRWFESHGKIEELLKGATKANISNPKLKEIKDIFLNPITQNEINELKEILKKVKLEILKSCYYAIVPKDVIQDNIEFNEPQTLENVLGILWQKYSISKSKTPNIFEFSQQVNSHLSEKDGNIVDIKKDLVNWIEKIREKLNLPQTIQEQKNDAIEENCSCLIITLAPEQQAFRLEASFILSEARSFQPEPLDLQVILNTNNQKEDEYSQKISRVGILCKSEKEIPNLINKIIEKFISRYSADISDLTIELFLPFKYISKNIDNDWRIQFDNLPDKLPIITHYPLILHFTDRFSGHSLLHLKKGWKRLIEVVNENCKQKSLLEKFETIPTLNQNKENLIRSLQDKIGLKLSSPLSKDKKGQEIFRAILMRGGTPIVFWTRHSTPSDLTIEQINCYLTVECLNNKLQKLVEQMCKIRQEAYAADDPKVCLGYHLGFLCDNPERSPIKELKEI